MRLGIFGGTFNPIHLAHLLIAESARETLKLDRVIFIPTCQPPHKSPRYLLSGTERLALIQLAIRDQPSFVASDIELQRNGPSYSIDTVKTLHAQLPMAKLFLIVGEDMLSVRWVGWDELLRLCTIVVAHRPSSKPLEKWLRARGYGLRAITPSPQPPAQNHYRSALERTKGCAVGALKWLPMPQIDISSSDIRARIKTGRSIRYMVPPAVERYIQQHHLYV